MAELELNRRYMGCVASFVDGIVSVKLLDGTVVQCEGVFSPGYVSINDDVRIEVRCGENDSRTYVLAAVRPKLDKQFLDKLKDCKNVSFGKNKAVAMLHFIDEQMKIYSTSLDSIDSDEIADLKKNEKETKDANDSADRRYNSNNTSIENDYTSNMGRTKLDGILKRVSDECVSLESKLEKLNIPAVSSEAIKNSDLIKAAARKLWMANRDLHDAYRKLADARKEVVYENYHNEKEQIRNKATLIEKKIRDEYRVRKNTASETAEESFYRLFLSSSLIDYCQKAESMRVKASSYTNPSSVPEFVVLGDVKCHVGNSSRREDDFIRLNDSTYPVLRKTNGGYVATIPYVQSYSDGISLLIEYSGNDMTYAQSLLQPLLLNMFMSFPAGKLEATIIDPLDIGSCFPDIAKLGQGPNTGRVIDTRIWSSEELIGNAMSRFRQHLENIMQAYGDDNESRLAKEVVKALAIADFPVGFSESALKDLRTIVRNARKLGVCVFICVNNDELTKLKNENSAIVHEILQSLTLAKVTGTKLMIQGFGSSTVELRIDMLRDVIEDKERIFSLLRSGIEHMQLKIEHFESLFKFDVHNRNNWFKGRNDEISLPIGIKGANTVVNFVLGRGSGSTEHHALIAGQTGAGKSTLLHTIIMSALVSYSPDDLQMYLLDFKEGVEFIDYTKYRLPSLRVIAINSEREFGLNVLKELCTELEKRAKLFTRYGTDNILDYANIKDAPKVPKLLFIFDEVQELFRSEEESDSVSSESLSCIKRLVTQGRAMGIHLILACQDFNNCHGLGEYFSQMAIRIAVKGAVDGASSILKSNNNGIKTLQNQPAGSAIYNGSCGEEFANNFFQISYISKDERLELLKEIDAYYTDPDVAPHYADCQSRILLTSAEDNINNCFNQLIVKGREGLTSISSVNGAYGLLLGQEFGKKGMFFTEMNKRDRDNILVVTKDERLALGIFDLSIMSILYDSLQNNEKRTHLYVVDLLDEEESSDECNFDFLGEKFQDIVTVVKIGELERLIASLYEMVQKRTSNPSESDSREFLMFFGINRAKRICAGGIYEGDSEEEMTPAEKLQKILVKGPKYGINSMFWGESIKSIESVIGDRYEAMFDKRIAYGLNEEAMETLVSEDDTKSLRGKTSVYMDIGKDVRNTHFRPYEVPAKTWVGRFADAFNRIKGVN